MFGDRVHVARLVPLVELYDQGIYFTKALWAQNINISFKLCSHLMIANPFELYQVHMPRQLGCHGMYKIVTQMESRFAGI